MVKKVITNFYLSKASGPDCILVVVLKICEPELSYILAEFFNKCLKETCFPDYLNDSLVVPVFDNVGEMSTTKNYHLVCLLSVISKVLKYRKYRNVTFFLISSMVLGLLDQLQIF